MEERRKVQRRRTLKGGTIAFNRAALHLFDGATGQRLSDTAPSAQANRERIGSEPR